MKIIQLTATRQKIGVGRRVAWAAEMDNNDINTKWDPTVDTGFAQSERKLVGRAYDIELMHLVVGKSLEQSSGTAVSL